MDDKECQASLCILVHVARAEGRVRSEEQLALEALGERYCGTSGAQALRDPRTFDELLAAVRSPELRRRTFIEAIALAGVDGRCRPEALALLERIRAAFGADVKVDLVAHAKAWKRRSAHLWRALDEATSRHLHRVKEESEHGELPMQRYEELVAELGKVKDELRKAFRAEVDEAEEGE